ncbi:hypothetical protein CJ030_MR1G009580 [Morella rubra]|uniref:Uncharacterized protein n=1 Tax=Morella rubra TaxID=262757 RepID=A0A6A1WP75_9ROSI|nr:hypothetical protein CJ030_MR1G009580 [Morella rubra]
MIPLTRNEVETYVPVTDKSDQQQREVEGTMILRNRSVKIVVILKNMTPRTKDDVMPAGGKRLRCDSSVRAESSPGTLAVSGPSLRDRTNYRPLTQPRRSAINKENRAKLKIVYTSGVRSFQRARALLKNPESDEISAALLYKKTHTNKDDMWTSEDARENFLEEARLQIEEMRARQLEYEALLVKRSDMEQTMQEHLQMMEEQQRRKMKS